MGMANVSEDEQSKTYFGTVDIQTEPSNVDSCSTVVLVRDMANDGAELSERLVKRQIAYAQCEKEIQNIIVYPHLDTMNCIVKFNNHAAARKAKDYIQSHLTKARSLWVLDFVIESLLPDGLFSGNCGTSGTSSSAQTRTVEKHFHPTSPSSSESLKYYTRARRGSSSVRQVLPAPQGMSDETKVPNNIWWVVDAPKLSRQAQLDILRTQKAQYREDVRNRETLKYSGAQNVEARVMILRHELKNSENGWFLLGPTPIDPVPQGVPDVLEYGFFYFAVAARVLVCVCVLHLCLVSR